jgi:hypothetical protein
LQGKVIYFITQATSDSDVYIYDSKSNLGIKFVVQRMVAKSTLPAQSAEWPAAQTGGDPKIRIQREPAIAFGLGHRHQMVFPPRFFMRKPRSHEFQ